MTKELSQEHIDELVATMRGDDAAAMPADEEPLSFDSTAAHARLFERTKRFSRQVMVMMEALHTQYAQEAAFYLSTQVGTRVNANVVRIEELSPQEFNQFLDTSSEHTVVAVFEFQDNPGLGVLQLETSIALPIYERMCGGVLGGVGEARKLTEIEFAVIRRTVEHLINEVYPAAWEPVTEVNILLQRVQTGREATLNLMDPWAVTLITLEVNVNGDVGLVYISLPYAMLEPFLDSMEARQPLTGSSKAIQEKYQGLLRSALQSVEIPVEVLLGRVPMTLSDFSALSVGDVVLFDQASSTNMPVLVGGRPKYMARAGRIGGQAAIQVRNVVRQRGSED